MKTKKRIIATAMLVLFSVSALVGCTAGNIGIGGSSSMNLMEGITVKAELTEKDITSWMNNQDMQKSVNDFGISLFKQSLGEAEGENLLVSPISVLYAMAMCANGADGETRHEMLAALIKGVYDGPLEDGMRETPGDGDIFDEWQEKLNGYLGSYLNTIENYAGDPERPADLHIANSIWVKNDDKLHVEEEFLQTNGKYYNAGVFKSDFDDAARKQINKWIEDNTKGLIKDMLKQMDEDAIMYLVNALGFEAEWSEVYDDYQVSNNIFHGEHGDKEVEFMYSDEWGYLSDELATGFIKYYAGWDYAFVGLLPNEGVTVDEYVAGLTGEGIYDMLTNMSDEKVLTALPKFKSESALSLVDVFRNMGVNDAFSVENADFTKLGSYEGRNILIGNILHNTYIEVDQKGTKAGAATVIEMLAGSAMPMEPPKEVYLDRPFVYMIIDANQNIPLFIGVERDI
ncbi:MAG: serpin family protein [Firmicutes bacterium]|nr:serpin family protein [Bacillota bacterium]